MKGSDIPVISCFFLEYRVETTQFETPTDRRLSVNQSHRVNSDLRQIQSL